MLSCVCVCVWVGHPPCRPPHRHHVLAGGGFVDVTKGSFKGEHMAFLVDGDATILGSTLESSMVTTYIESAMGIKEGGRMGITTITLGLYFLLSLFFTLLLTSMSP